MGISNRSHGKKSDKETQSPVLKLFRDMMQREKHDPEKTNLLKTLKNKADKRKKKRSTEFRCKSDKTGESSSSGRYQPYNGKQALLNAEYERARTPQSHPFHGEKKESWWFWGDQAAQKPASEDTCSCVSCALKKIINTDYACMACLVLLFTVSVVIAFLLVYKSIPCMSEKSGSQKTLKERLKRRSDGLSKMWDHLGKKTARGTWDNGVSRYGLSQSMTDRNSYQDLSSLVDSNSELVKLLDNDLIGEIQNSERLREFYKKLIKTDSQIQNLKKNNEINLKIDERYRTYPERAKRSLNVLYKPLKLFHFRRNKKNRTKENEMIHEKDKINKNNADTDAPAFKTEGSKSIKMKTSRHKRLNNASEPEGFIIENKKVLVQYKPVNRKSKCSHAPKESKSHENQLKHPFYQNTQRLDELLDRFLDKNLPELLSDQLGLDLVFEKVKKCKHPKVETDTNVKTHEGDQPDIFNNDIALPKHKDEIKNDVSLKEIENDFTKIDSETSTRSDIFADSTTANNYGLLMSISTMMYNDNNFKQNNHHPLVDRVPNARKLLQIDADDEMNEVMVAHDDKEDMKKWVDEPTLEDMSKKLKMNPTGILNPNWKGPMPLYPDELNSVVKQEPVIVNRVETPVNKYESEANADEGFVQQRLVSEADKKPVNEDEFTLSKDLLSEEDELEGNLNDMEYIEDYFRNKYDRLVEMAQAYSDYGVLEGRKTTDKKVDAKVKIEEPDHKIKLSLNGFKEGFRNSIFGRPKKAGSQHEDVPSEGFRLEFHTNSPAQEDSDLVRAINKHIKISNYKPKAIPDVPIGQPNMYLPKNELKNSKINADMFFVGKGKRTLKAVDYSDVEVKSDDGSFDENDYTNISNADIFLIRKLEIDNSLVTKSSNTMNEEPVSNSTENVFDSIHLIRKRRMNVTEHNNIIDDETSMPLEGNNENTKSKEVKEYGFDKILKKREVTENNSTSNAKIMATIDIDTNKTKLKEANSTEKAKAQINSDTDDMNLSEFFSLLANWFGVLDGVNVNSNYSVIENSSQLNQTYNKTNETVEVSYPAYDSDMIENIGHRSRVLLSVDLNDTVKVDKEEMKVDSDKISNLTNLKDIDKKENKTKTIVKRNAEDSNLIFWNDIYDDEYGIVDHLEDNLRDKQSIRTELIKRPKEWFHDKVKKIAEGFHRKAENLRKKEMDAKTKKENLTNEDVKLKTKANKRVSRNTEDNRQKTDFAALTAKMKKICRKAAKDVAQANRLDVREVSKDGHVTTSLMQQLVRMMGDLVDYQVQQRTCRTLPPDLQNFLEWLTSSQSEDNKYSSDKDENPETEFGKTNDKSDEEHTLSSSEGEEGLVSRSDCLGTLQAVEELMRQYEDMADDDKSKMTGVKEYLENQIQYLKKQLLPIHDDISLYTDSIRFRRDIPETLKDKKPKKHRLKQKFKNYINNINKKYHDHFKSNNKADNFKKNNDSRLNKMNKVKNNDITDNSNKNDGYINKSNKDKNNDKKNDIENIPVTVKEKRNLRDVYYKALADAKKLTTKVHIV